MNRRAWFRRMLQRYEENDMSVYAGYATLYFLISLFPTIMLILAVLNLIPGYSTEDFINAVFRFLPDLEALRGLFLDIVDNLKSQSSSLLASVTALTTLWSASNGVSAIQRGLKKITRNAESSPWDKPLALLYTLLFIIMIPALFLFSLLGGFFSELVKKAAACFGLGSLTGMLSGWLRASGIASLLAAFLVILLTFRYLPGGKRSVKEHIPGALFTAVLWGIFSSLFSFFITHFFRASRIYGSLASMFLAIMWLRILFSIMFLGVSINTTLQEEKEEREGSGETPPGSGDRITR